MKILDVPKDPITILPAEESRLGKEQKVTFPEFGLKAMDNYMPDNPTIGMLRKANAICDQLENLDGSKVWSMGDDYYEIFKSAVEKSVCVWVPKCARRLLPFYDAVEKTQDVETPAKK